MLRVRAKRDVSFGFDNAIDLVEAVSDDGGDLVMLSDSDERYQVDLSRDAVDLTDAIESCDLLGNFWNSRNIGADKDYRCDHACRLLQAHGRDRRAGCRKVATHHRTAPADMRAATAHGGNANQAGSPDKGLLRSSVPRTCVTEAT